MRDYYRNDKVTDNYFQSTISIKAHCILNYNCSGELMYMSSWHWNKMIVGEAEL